MKRRILFGVLCGVPLLALVYYTISPFFTVLETNESNPAGESTRVLAEARVVDTPAHPASGVVRIVEADGKVHVRYEEYETINGPDIFVYLAKDLDARDAVNIGRVKSTKGNANYEVPAGVDITEYRYVLTWCRAFGVLFNYADISL